MSDGALVHTLDGQALSSSAAPRMPEPVSGGSFGWARIPLTIIGIITAIGLVVYLAVAGPVSRLVGSTQRLKGSVAAVATAAKSQDLGAVSAQLAAVETDLVTVRADYGRLKWLKVLPVVNLYYRDGDHALAAAKDVLDAGKITVDTLTPYADVVGLKGLATTGDGAKTAQDRINFVIETLDKIKPQLSQIGEKLAHARQEVDQINPKRYPEKIRNRPVRPQLVQAISLLDQAAVLVNDAQPLLGTAPYILGKDKPRKYLVIFQNDAELRPTGGFMTAYAIIQVDKGKISTIQSNDIYTLDAKFTKKVPAPDPIKKYLPSVPYWYLRDQNLSPDFKVSMETFFPNYQSTKSPEVEGVIAVDTKLLVDLLKVTGPIGVPGFGNFSADEDKRCNCPQAFYELELFADVEGPVVWSSLSGEIVYKPKNYGERKSFIGPMMYSVLANVMAQPKHKIPDLFSTVQAAIAGKHVLFYFVDPAVQTAVESFNLAGRVRDFAGDYLMVVDTNFAGAKTNAWVTYSADQKIEVGGDGTVTKTLTLTYKNPQQYFEDPATKLKLNGKFRNWLRVYVPKGSELLEAKGFETGQAVGEDLDKTVFEGFFTLTPLNVSTITLKYKLPLKVKSGYRLLVQKQGGSKDFVYKTSVNGRSQEEVVLSSDRELVWTY